MSHPVTPSPQGRAWALALVALCLALPWLNPFAPGPSTVVVPWLAAAFATMAAWALADMPSPPRAWLGVCGAACAVLLPRPGGLSPETWMTLGALALIAVAAAVGKAAAREGRLLDCIAAAWAAAALASAVIGMVQYLGLSQPLAPWINPSAAGEGFGNLRQRNQFATLTAIGLLAVLAVCRRWPHAGRWSMLAVCILAAGNASSVSRTGALQLLLVAAATPWLGGREERGRLLRLAAAAVGAYAAAALALPWLLQVSGGPSGTNAFVRMGTDYTCASRAVLWSNVAELVAQRPWMGWGLGELDYAHYMHFYAGARFCEILDNAHNLPLQLAVELGVPVALAACAAVAAFIWSRKPWRAVDPAAKLGWGVFSLLLIHSAVEYPLWYAPFQVALGMATGMVLGSGVTSSARRHIAWNAAVLAGLVLCCYAAWDYRRVSQMYIPPQLRAPEYRQDTLGAAQRSWLFRNQARFAQLTVTVPDRANALELHGIAGEMLHYSPEPQVAQRMIETAVLLGRDSEAMFHLDRMRAAFPAEYARWSPGLPGRDGDGRMAPK